MKLFKKLKKSTRPIAVSKESGPVCGELNNNFKIYFGVERNYFIQISPEEARKLGEQLISFARYYGNKS